MNLRINLSVLLLFSTIASYTQSNSYWQQHVDYKMAIDVDVKKYRYHGIQELVYSNNSPDTLKRVYYHLHLNAFQPGSEMDARVQSLTDPDKRMVTNLGTADEPRYQSRISKLKPNEIGYINVNSLKQNEVEVSYKTVGTILEVKLHAPILPGEKTTFTMDFDAQIPVQIRRTGRNNEEGVALSMTQWYPKIAEYDFEGWHANSYIQREFHGVWGNYDVKIQIDKDYVLGGTGILQNPEAVGHGYGTIDQAIAKEDKLTWHFKALQVHDFAWAADPDYIHDKMQVPNGPTIHFLYKNNPKIVKKWNLVQPFAVELMRYLSDAIGEYPYDQYSIIQGGDGGMEYPMCTLITGDRDFESLFNVIDHEMAHSWFHLILATNESKHAWMDEGFTNFIDTKAANDILNKGLKNPFESAYSDYFEMVEKGIDQPLTTHSDRYVYNKAYGTSAYDKGAIFLVQLGYIVGEDNLRKTLKRYFDEWSFKHPTPNDFIRVAEKVSGLELGWYLLEWTQTTNTIDYAITGVSKSKKRTRLELKRYGLMPMPLDLTVTLKSGETLKYHIPLRMIRGHKPVSSDVEVLKDWAWAYETYNVIIDVQLNNIRAVEIDPSERLADINRNNNYLIPN